MKLIKNITRTDRKSNGKEVRHQVDKKETYIQTGRRGGDGHRGGEDLRGCGGTETGASVGQTGQAVRALADPATLYLCTDKLRGPDSEWRRKGLAERRVAPYGPTLVHR